MGKHFYADKRSGRTRNPFRNNGFVDGFYLLQGKFPRQHNHIGKLGVKAERFNVGDTQLGGNMHLQANPSTIQDGGHV